MLTTVDATSHTPVLPSPAPDKIMHLAKGARRSLVRWLNVRRQLRALQQLDDHLLRDIGLSRADVARACSSSFWTLAVIIGLLFTVSATPAVAQEICKPILSPKSAEHSEVADFQRRWTVVFTVDASRCATTSGAFEIEMVRLKETAPDLSFTEQFAWMAGETQVNVDLTWDEWVDSHRIGAIVPCPCRR